MNCMISQVQYITLLLTYLDDAQQQVRGAGSAWLQLQHENIHLLMYLSLCIHQTRGADPRSGLMHAMMLSSSQSFEE